MATKKNTNEILTEQFLKKYNISPKEFLILYAIILHKGSEFSESLQKLQLDGSIKLIENLNGRISVNKVFIATEKGEDLIRNCLANTDPTKDNDIETLAIQMKELFPKGSKSPGHPWRSNTKEVIDKLKRFKISYTYSDDQILEATADYIKTMQNSPYMRTLKHFIIKKVNDEIVSDLASFIENDKQTIYDRFDINYRPDTGESGPNELSLF